LALVSKLREFRAKTAQNARAARSPKSILPVSNQNTPASFRAVCGSVSASPEPWSWNLKSFSWTSHLARALDAQTRLVLQEQLARLVEQSGTTAILVTHSIEEAVLLADKVLVMTARPGRIAAEIGIDLPRPRSMATTHLSGYSALFDRIYGLLRNEVLKAMVIESETA